MQKERGEIGGDVHAHAMYAHANSLLTGLFNVRLTQRPGFVGLEDYLSLSSRVRAGSTSGNHFVLHARGGEMVGGDGESCAHLLAAATLRIATLSATPVEITKRFDCRGRGEKRNPRRPCIELI